QKERILNAFSHDMKTLDEMLTPTLLEFTQYTMMIAGSIVVIMIISNWLIIPTVVLLICTFTVGYLCFPSTRALKKIEVSSQPSSDDLHSSALYLMNCAVHAPGLWMGLFSVLYTACITLGYRMLIPDLKPAHLGLATYCSLVLTSLVPEAVTYCAYTVTQLASAGKILQLSKLEKEELDTLSPPVNKDSTSEVSTTGWPQRGDIEAKHLTLQYSQDKPCVLQNLNFSIKSGKVGVVGCVGAGKSALISALLRMAKLQSTDALWIDDVNISTIPLRLLRRKISVIPRYPVLFSGHLRLNLDPHTALTDNVLWDALEKESGHPYLLLQNEYSQFYKMVHQTGSAVKTQLIQLARE
ncbi:hypothetical protein L9F63_022564, partial [Diploptera punctata]